MAAFANVSEVSRVVINHSCANRSDVLASWRQVALKARLAGQSSEGFAHLSVRLRRLASEEVVLADRGASDCYSRRHRKAGVAATANIVVLAMNRDVSSKCDVRAAFSIAGLPVGGRMHPLHVLLQNPLGAVDLTAALVWASDGVVVRICSADMICQFIRHARDVLALAAFKAFLVHRGEVKLKRLFTEGDLIASRTDEFLDVCPESDGWVGDGELGIAFVLEIMTAVRRSGVHREIITCRPRRVDCVACDPCVQNDILTGLDELTQCRIPRLIGYLWCHLCIYRLPIS